MGVIGNRLGAGQGCSDGDPHTASVGPAPQGLSAGKTSPNTPVVWGGPGQSPEKHPVCPPRLALNIQDLTQPSCPHSEASVVPPCLTDSNTEG